MQVKSSRRLHCCVTATNAIEFTFTAGFLFFHQLSFFSITAPLPHCQADCHQAGTLVSDEFLQRMICLRSVGSYLFVLSSQLCRARTGPTAAPGFYCWPSFLRASYEFATRLLAPAFLLLNLMPHPPLPNVSHNHTPLTQSCHCPAVAQPRSFCGHPDWFLGPKMAHFGH